MITFQSLGRSGQLANQLFQYALLFAVSKRTGYDFGVPYKNVSTNKFEDFTLPYIFPNLTAKDSSDFISEYQYQEKDKDFWTFLPDVFDVKDNTNFNGYFQAEKYFLPHREDLLNEFTSLPIYSERASNVLSALRSKDRQVVFLHVRRGDALYNKSLVQPTISYYYQAVKHFPDAHFIILTDDRRWCRRLRLHNMSFSPFVDKFDDFELMRQADGGIICSSTFSWWGAWLGNPQRKIVMPKKWSKTHSAGDILVDNWIKE